MDVNSLTPFPVLHGVYLLKMSHRQKGEVAKQLRRESALMTQKETMSNAWTYAKFLPTNARISFFS